MKSVYSAVRTGSLNKADYVSSVKGSQCSWLCECSSFSHGPTMGQQQCSPLCRSRVRNWAAVSAILRIVLHNNLVRIATSCEQCNRPAWKVSRRPALTLKKRNKIRIQKQKQTEAEISFSHSCKFRYQPFKAYRLLYVPAGLTFKNSTW